jgi:uncharacterized membrane protein
MSRSLAAALTCLSLLWAIVILVAPFGLGEGSLAAWLVYDVAGGICHQRPERSFHLAGVPMPVCARCSGLYLSGAAGALFAWLAPSGTTGLTGRTRAALALAASPTAVTFGVEQVGLFPFSNGARAVAAVPLGVAAGWLFVRALRGEGAASAAVPQDAL